ncbi:MAG: cation diffusion facilitator family transporter [Roseinatronobacter sp.]
MTKPASDPKRRVTVLGAWINVVLSLAKIGAGVVLGSPALVADGVHSLSDLASDIMVIWALRHAARGPDANHPYGHGRFETLATLALGVFLAFTGIIIGWDGVQRLWSGGTEPPGIWAFAVVTACIGAKEWLFRYTLAVGKRTGSALLMANAWHHRSDALSSIVALVGIGAAQLGFGWGDPLAALIIAGMLVQIAWRFGAEAAVELVDTQPPDDLRDAVLARLSETPGVVGHRDLRMRQHGARVLADVSVMVDPAITVTEAHRIAEAARAHALSQIDALEDVVIHIEPAGHFDGFGAETAPLRAEIEGMILTLTLAHPSVVRVERIGLGYFDDGLTVEAVVALTPEADAALTEADVTLTLRAALQEVSQVRLHRVAGDLQP